MLGSAADSGGAASSHGGMSPQDEACRRGQTSGGNISRAQERLDRQNAAFARSFADHAERVAKKTRADHLRETVPAAERLAALRRRVCQRQRAERDSRAEWDDTQLRGAQGQISGGNMTPQIVGEDVTVGPGGADARGRLAERVWTIEVPKMHLTHSSESVQGNDGQRHDGGGYEFVGGVDSEKPAAGYVCKSAAEKATASQVAWHSEADRDGFAPV